MGGLATGSGAGIFDRLFDPDVNGVMARLDGPIPEPAYPEEARVVAPAVPRRRIEFLAGRACAHAALAAIGRDGTPVLVGPRREPVWPPGIVGSIAHGGDWAAAVVTTDLHARGLGLDIERLDPPLPPEVTGMVLTSAEGRRLPSDHARADSWAKVAFTAKECVYKALYPSTGWLLEHADVEIDLDLDEGRFHATLAERFPLEVGTDELTGRFEVVDSHIFAGLRVGDGRARGGET